MNNQQPPGNRIFPAHANEALVFYTLRQSSVIDAINYCVSDYASACFVLPDIICVNQALIPRVYEEVRKRKDRACIHIPIKDISWFYASKAQQRALPEACFIVVYNSKIGIASACTL